MTPPEEAGQGRAETSERRQDARLILVMRGLRSLAYGLLAVLLQRVAERYGYARWLSNSMVPKLFVNADPGSILTGAQREFCRSWPNQEEVTVKGIHFVQEDSPAEIGEAIARFLGRIS